MILSIRKKRPSSFYKKRDNRDLIPLSCIEFKSCKCEQECKCPSTQFEHTKHLMTIPFGPYVHICQDDKCPPQGIPIVDNNLPIDFPCNDCR